MIERQTMTARETAAYLGISMDLVYSMTKAGALPALKIGRRILFRKETLDRWMQSQEMKVQTEVVNNNVSTGPNFSAMFRQ